MRLQSVQVDVDDLVVEPRRVVGRLRIRDQVLATQHFRVFGDFGDKSPHLAKYIVRGTLRRLDIGSELNADGTKLWVYEPEEEQAIVDPNFKTSELSTSISFLWGEGKLSDAFTATAGKPETYAADKTMGVLELVPKKDATYTKLVLVLDPTSPSTSTSDSKSISGASSRSHSERRPASSRLRVPSTFDR